MPRNRSESPIPCLLAYRDALIDFPNRRDLPYPEYVRDINETWKHVSKAHKLALDEVDGDQARIDWIGHAAQSV